MNISKGIFKVVVGLLFITWSCKTSRLANIPSATKTLCGTFICDDSLFDTLSFTNWNTVEVMTEYIPPSSYFITGDTLVVIPDKSFLMYRIVDENKLVGLEGWAHKDKLVKIPQSDLKCEPFRNLSQEQETWLSQNKAYFKALYSKDLELMKEQLLALCQEGHSRSCLNYGALTLDYQAEKPDLTYIQKACEMGDYMGCYRMGELNQRFNDLNVAKEYYQKSCDMGHLASCMGIDLLEIDDSKK